MKCKLGRSTHLWSTHKFVKKPCYPLGGGIIYLWLIFYKRTTFFVAVLMWEHSHKIEFSSSPGPGEGFKRKRRSAQQHNLDIKLVRCSVDESCVITFWQAAARVYLFNRSMLLLGFLITTPWQEETSNRHRIIQMRSYRAAALLTWNMNLGVTGPIYGIVMHMMMMCSEGEQSTIGKGASVSFNNALRTAPLLISNTYL